MSSTLTIRSPGQSPIDSSAINQFVQALTGVMMGQPFTLANTLTVSNMLTASSQATVTNLLTASSALTVTNLLTASSALTVNGNSALNGIASVTGNLSLRPAIASSAAVQVLAMGSSGPSLYFGSSTPTIGCTVPSLFFNTGGSSTTGLYVCIPNGGTASSSNWDTLTLT